MSKYLVKAHYLQSALDLQRLPQVPADWERLRKERNVLLFRAGDNKYVGLFSFGVVATLGFGDEVDQIVELFGQPYDIEQVEPEEYEVIIDPDQPETVDFETIFLHDFDPEKVLLVFWAAAQSVVIDYHEGRMDRALSGFERVHRNLMERGKLVMNSREAMRMIGLGGSSVNVIISKLSLLDKPDITWEEEDAERLHLALRRQFELDDRFSILRDKINFLQESSKTVLEVLQDRKSAWLEVIIIVLIAMEFMFFVFTEIL